MYIKDCRFFAIILSFSLLAAKVLAQPTFDTIKYSFQHPPSLFAKFGTKNSFINNYRAKVLGVKLGVSYNRRVRLGLGYNQLYSSATFFDKKIYYTNSLDQIDSTDAHLRLWYFSLLAEYVYHQNHQWKFSIPIQLGAGENRYVYKTNNKSVQINNNFMVIYEPAVSVEYKAIKWVGLGADIGFRFVLTNYKHLSEKLNSPTYAFKLLIYYDTIYRQFKSKQAAL